MRTDKKIIDSQLSAIETIKFEFLKFANHFEPPSPKELKARHERIKGALADCGGSLDDYWVMWLFGELEQRAVDELRKVTLLAQTTEPESLKKYFPELNEQLVDNAKAVKKYHQNQYSTSANDAKTQKKIELGEEIIHRTNWFLKNPEPDYRENVYRYRSSTIAVSLINNWGSRKRPDLSGKDFSKEEAWENNKYPKAPSLGVIKNAIRTGVNSGKLPSFLLKGKPKK